MKLNQGSNKLDEIKSILESFYDRLEKDENELSKLKRQIEEKKKDKWDKLRIVGSFSTALMLAIATFLGTTIIPEKISQQSLESQKIIQLSNLVPKLYKDSTAIRPLVIAMSSYKAPAVPFLLLVLEHATENEKEYLLEPIKSTMKYMDKDARDEIRLKLEFEVANLSEQHLSHNVEYIGHIIDILNSFGTLDRKTLRTLRQYFSIVSNFETNQFALTVLNGKVLRVLSTNRFLVVKLHLNRVHFDGEDLSKIDFTNAKLSYASLANCNIIDSKFAEATLDSCNLKGAVFYSERDDERSIRSIFERFSKAKWKKAILDEKIRVLLTELSKENRDEAKISTLVKSLWENQ